MSLLHANEPFVIAFVIATIVAVALGLQVQLLIRRASVRHAALLAAVLLPPLFLGAAALGLRIPRPSSPASADVAITASPDRDAATEKAASSLPIALSAVWLAGAILGLTRIAIGTARWRAVAARAEVITDSALLDRIDSRCVVARSAECGEPTVIGIVQPVIVLPAVSDFEAAELDAVFAHELAHVDRRDNLTALLVQIVCALFWFDPLHRVARRKLFELRERACDELVLERGCDARAYVTALARSTRSTLEHNHAVACMSRLKLQERMESIMTHDHHRRFPAWITRLTVIAAMAAAAIGFATFSPAPVLTAGELPTASDFDVHVVPHGGRFTVTVRIDTPEGPVTSIAVVRSAPDVRTISTTVGGKTYRVEVSLAVDGSAVGRYDVIEGTNTLTMATKTFAAPEILVGGRQMGDEPPPPPPPPLRKLDASMTRPIVLYRVEPAYTVEAKINRVSGIVITEVVIDETGAVTDVKVLKPLPFGLDKSAVDAIRQWRFAPAMADGKPVATKFTITINFKSDE